MIGERHTLFGDSNFEDRCFGGILDPRNKQRGPYENIDNRATQSNLPTSVEMTGPQIKT